MGFWIFMTVIVLLMPISMIGFGRLFIRKPPDQINSFYGYRTRMSMKNKETWNFAHYHFGKLWWILGWILLVVSIVLQIYVMGQDENTVGLAGGVVVAVQLLSLCCCIIPVERALKKNFDADGFRR